MNFKKSLVLYTSIVLAMIFWSLSFVWYKQAFLNYRPVTVILFRQVIAVPLLFLISILAGKFRAIKKEHLGSFLILGFLQPFLYFICESFGVQLLSATTASVIVSTIPLFAPLFGRIYYNERFSVMNYAGLIISFGGVLLILQAGGDLNFEHLAGVLLMLVAVFSALFYTVYVKKLIVHYSSATVVAYQNLIGMFLFIPVFLITDLDHFLGVRHTVSTFLPVIELAVFASSLAFVFFVFAIKHVGISRSNVFTNLIPAFTAVFSYFILGEQFPALKVTGVFIVIGGLLFTQFQIKRDKGQKKAGEERPGTGDGQEHDVAEIHAQE